MSTGGRSSTGCRWGGHLNDDPATGDCRRGGSRGGPASKVSSMAAASSASEPC